MKIGFSKGVFISHGLKPKSNDTYCGRKIIIDEYAIYDGEKDDITCEECKQKI